MSLQELGIFLKILFGDVWIGFTDINGRDADQMVIHQLGVARGAKIS